MAKRKSFAPLYRRQGGFIVKHREWLESSAYRDLSLTARCLLDEFLLVHQRAPNQNGRLGLSVEKAAPRLGICENTAGPAFHELLAHGFIALGNEAVWVAGKAREYRLTFLPYNGREPTDEWRDWTPDDPVVPVRCKARQQQNHTAKSEAVLLRICTASPAKSEGVKPVTQGDADRSPSNSSDFRAPPAEDPLKSCAPYRIPSDVDTPSPRSGVDTRREISLVEKRSDAGNGSSDDDDLLAIPEFLDRRKARESNGGGCAEPVGKPATRQEDRNTSCTGSAP